MEELARAERRATAEAETHLRLATSLPSRDLALGGSVVVLTSLSAVGVAILGEPAGLGLRLAIGFATSVAFVLASLQAFFRYGVHAAHYRDAAMEWSAIRRELDALLAGSAFRHEVGEPRAYLEKLHARTEELSARPAEFGDWRRLLAERWAEFRAVAIAASGPRETWPTEWTAAVRTLLKDWENRAVYSMNVHYAEAEKLASRHRLLSAPVVGLTILVAMCVFTTLGDDLGLWLRIFSGSACLLAALLASLSTFLRPGAGAQQAGRAAARWASIRRAIARVRSVRMGGESLGDPKAYLDDLRLSMNTVSAESPEVSYQQWSKASTPAESAAEGSEEAVRRYQAVFPHTRLVAPVDGPSSSPFDGSITE